MLPRIATSLLASAALSRRRILSSVNTLPTFLAADYRTTIGTIEHLTLHNRITFNLLYTILVPRTLIVAH
jgi:hypothetical protein